MKDCRLLRPAPPLIRQTAQRRPPAETILFSLLDLCRPMVLIPRALPTARNFFQRLVSNACRSPNVLFSGKILQSPPRFLALLIEIGAPILSVAASAFASSPP